MITTFVVSFIKSLLLGFASYIFWGVIRDYIPKGARELLEEPFNLPGALVLWYASRPIFEFFSMQKDSGIISDAACFNMSLIVTVIIGICLQFVGLSVLKIIRKYLPDVQGETQDD